MTNPENPHVGLLFSARHAIAEKLGVTMDETFNAIVRETCHAICSQDSLQQRVQPWLMECFGPMIAGDREERNHRFLEEAIELVQACGCSASEAHQLVDYVYGRPVGEPDQEVGGVMITLAALCLANGLDMHDAGERELARIWTMVEKIRAKQASKPKHSPLPAAPAASGLRFPTMLRKMWSGAEVQAWLDEQGELIRLRDIPEGCTPTDARVLREANHKLAEQQHQPAYDSGKPTKTGVYAVRVDDPMGSGLMKDMFLMWIEGRWGYLGSDQFFRGAVHGWIGPLPRKVSA
ncbi:hypothetical protein [Piscinibacter gummiphilus]|uniref:Uncharacterized protein n=1 Tax=Piscinibacter gummiphilus TaxID=946333 RepID=A0ABZ0CPR1_9BURK|nr:hypothetical protein [Piscinibacter gummiphilus]WOB06516.1 hypothetical protein RXV79_16460 [Piscinibacter gummiphilus]